MTEKIGNRYPVPYLEIGEQRHQRFKLRCCIRLDTVIVQLDADGIRIHIDFTAPVRRPRVPGALQLINEVIKGSIARDQEMRADLGARTRQRPQCILCVGITGVVQNHKARPALIEIGGGILYGRQHRIGGEWRFGGQWRTSCQQNSDRHDGRAKPPGGGARQHVRPAAPACGSKGRTPTPARQAAQAW